jgi:hypothetical protein
MQEFKSSVSQENIHLLFANLVCPPSLILFP